MEKLPFLQAIYLQCSLMIKDNHDLKNGYYD